MRVLVIGNDRRLFDHGSENFDRIKKYATLFEELHIVIFTPSGFKPHDIEGRLFLWPTNSLSSVLWIWDAFFVSLKIIKKRKIDIIDSQDAGFSGLVAYVLSRYTGTLFRLQIHTDILSPYFRSASWKEWLHHALSRLLIPRANCIRVVSERIKKSLVTRYPLRAMGFSVLPIFTDNSKFFSAIPDSEVEEYLKDYDFKMVAVGRFVDKEKNFSMLIGVMRDFVKICPKAVLVLVGDGPDRASYQFLVVSYGLEKNVTIEGWKDDLASFYKSFDLFVLSSNYEGWGRVVIEAMASGLPVVMTDVGLAGEVLKGGENGLVVPVADASALLGAIEKIYHDPQKRLEFALAGQETVMNLKPQTEEEYLILYKKFLSSCIL